MEQQQAPEVPPAVRPPRRWMVVIAVAVAAIIVLSALALVFYMQAADYRESKYRAQYQIVDEMVTFLPVENVTIDIMLNAELEIGERRAAAFSAVRIAEMLSGDALSLAVMYDNEDERYMALFALGGAFSALATNLSDGYAVLSSPSHVFTEDYVLGIMTASGITTSILGYLNQGLLAGVDGIVDPYHVIDGMPIGSIASAAAVLAAAVS